MTVLNGIDRFHLALDVIDQVPQLRSRAGAVRERLLGKLVEHRHHVHTHGEDMAEVRDWQFRVDGNPGGGTSQDSAAEGGGVKRWRPMSRGSTIRPGPRIQKAVGAGTRP